MKEFPKDIEFKYPWRSYQQRVLDELDNHLEDDHLHVVAPPGSGKTILGLEVALRLNRPTLIFTPTISIRNQWIQRFTELFLQTEDVPAWISRDIRCPAFLTVSTYQGLFAACSGSEEQEEDDEDEEETDEGVDGKMDFSSSKGASEIISRLKKNGVRTIIVDEAHHLKNAWWKSLDEVKKHLSPTIVGLTATPPYDVSYTEWKRYLDLNGPVDAEISIPELVIENELCPHQDYVIISNPTEEESEKLLEYRNRIERLVESVLSDLSLKEFLSKLRIFTHPKEELEWIYSNIEEYSATIIFLNSRGVEISPLHLDVIGDAKIAIPELDYEWLEILLKFYLFSTADFLKGNEVHKENLLNRLKRNGVIERKSINLRYLEKTRKLLTSSLSKLESIKEIVAFESNQLKESLRMVILTDFIRKEYLVQQSENSLPISKIGVLPIFERLRREEDLAMKIGVLTGSVIIIPTIVVDAFKQISSDNGIDAVSLSELSYDASYTQIHTSAKLKQKIVHIITHLFELGHIHILVGTKSLLGQGWDAPSINSLILASFVGSYVSSNQMRGRAIRKLYSNENKTSNIWHLACADLGQTEGGADIEILKRRFKTFVGVSYSPNLTLENGIGRIGIPKRFDSREVIETFNQRTYNLAGKREELGVAWKKALEAGNFLIEEIKVPFSKGNYKENKSLYLKRTLAYLFAVLVSGLSIYEEISFKILSNNILDIRKPEDLYWWISILGFIGFAIFWRLLIKSLRLFFQYRDISKDLKNIGIALLDTLCELNQITTDRSELGVEATQDEYGAMYCHLKGGSTFEKSLFIQSLAEIVDQIDNPRYLIVRKSLFFNFKRQRDYHSVPESIARTKNMAQKFEENWRKQVGNCELIFTRNIEGRKMLLRSRLRSLATALEGNIDRVNKWK